jgi:heat shock protein HslJ
MRGSRDTRTFAAVTALLAVAVCAGCATRERRAAAPPAGDAAPRAGTAPRAVPGGPLAGTTWRLVEFQSMDDAVGTTRPSDPSLYVMTLQGDGKVAMRLNCNRATGSWSAEPSADPSNGGFRFGPLAATRALCPPPSLDERIVADAASVRGYMIRDGRLSLSLMADAGIYVWERAGDTSTSGPAFGVR